MYVINLLAFIEDAAELILKDTNLDLGSRAGAHGTSVEGFTAIILGIVDHLALKELGGINVSIRLHVLNLVALIHTRRAVLELTTTSTIILRLVVLLVVLVLVVVVVLARFFASLAHAFLFLLVVLNSGLEVGVKVNQVLAIVGVARSARLGASRGVFRRTKTENDKTLRLEDRIKVLLLGEFITVRLDELTLFELDGICRNVDNIILLVKRTVELRVGRLDGTAHQLGHVLGLGIVLADSSKRIGRYLTQSGHKGSKSNKELHDAVYWKATTTSVSNNGAMRPFQRRCSTNSTWGQRVAKNMEKFSTLDMWITSPSLRDVCPSWKRHGGPTNKSNRAKKHIFVEGRTRSNDKGAWNGRSWRDGRARGKGNSSSQVMTTRTQGAANQSFFSQQSLLSSTQQPSTCTTLINVHQHGHTASHLSVEHNACDLCDGARRRRRATAPRWRTLSLLIVLAETVLLLSRL